VPAPTVPAWSLDALKLPKAIEGDSLLGAINAGLRARARPLWDGGALSVPTARWGPALASALERAQREGSLVRGLEVIEKTLEREAHGLSLVDQRSGAQRGSRVSRLILVTNDGTPRFYRQVERLLAVQGPRLLVIYMDDADSTQFAAVIPQGGGVVRALMLEHKELVAGALVALYAKS